jgi:hypothetical protein
MSTIPQFFVHEALSNPGEKIKEFDYWQPMSTNSSAMSRVDPLGARVVYCTNPSLLGHTPPGTFGLTGIKLVAHPLSSGWTKTLEPATFLGFGKDPFAIDMHFFISRTSGDVNLRRYPLFWAGNGIRIEMHADVNGSILGPIKFFHVDPYRYFGEVPKAVFNSAFSGANNNWMNFSFCRDGNVCRIFFGSQNLTSYSKVSEYYTEDIFDIPAPTEPLYFFSTPEGPSLNVSANEFSVRVTRGVLRQEHRISPTLYSNSPYPTRLPPVRTVWPVSGPVSALSHFVGKAPRVPVITRSTWNPSDNNPKIWYDARDLNRIVFGGLLPTPVSMTGKPGQLIVFAPEQGTDAFMMGSICPTLVKNGVLASYKEYNVEQRTSLFSTSSFNLYAVYAQGFDNLSAQFNAAYLGYSGQFGEYFLSNSTHFVFGYDGASVFVKFYLTGSFSYNPRTLLLTETIPITMQTKGVPAILHLRRIGNSWEFGVNGAVKEFEFSASLWATQHTVCPWFNAPEGYGVVFYEAAAFDGYLSEEDHAAALEYFNSKHGVSSGFGWANVEVGASVGAGAIQRESFESLHISAKELQFFVPEEQLPVLVNIDMSNENACTFNEQGRLIQYRDLADKSRVFNLKANYGDPSGGLQPASWGGRFKTFAPENSTHFESTKRYNAPNGQTLFYVGRMPRILLQQGHPAGYLDQFYYGLGGIEDFQRGGLRIHLTARIIGESTSYWDGYLIYNFYQTLRADAWEFVDVLNYCTTGGSYGNEYVATALPHITCIKGNGVANFHLNGGNQWALAGSGVPQWTAGDVLRICGGAYGSYFSHKYEFAQFLLIDGVLNDVTMRKVVGQLAHKWNLVGKLAAQCPYHNAPPLI